MKEQIGNFIKDISIASGEIYLGYIAMGIFPIGTLAGVLLIERGVRNLENRYKI